MRARLAVAADLDFISADSELPAALLRRKVRWLEIIIALNGRERTGYLELDFLWSQSPCISRLRVSSPEQYDPVGRVLLSFTHRFLRQRGYDLLLSSSRIGTQPAHDWHRRLGFAPCGMVAGVRPGGGSEVFYQKRLVPLRRGISLPRPEPFVENLLSGVTESSTRNASPGLLAGGQPLGRP